MKRVLVPIVGQSSIAHIIRSGLLGKLKGYCKPIVVLLWNQEDLIDELTKKGFEVHIMPAYEISADYSILREKINVWYKYFLLKTPSTEIEKKFRNKYMPVKRVLKRRIKEFLLRSRFLYDKNYIKKLIEEESRLIKEQPCYLNYMQWLNDLHIDGLFTVTPFLQQIELAARFLRSDNKTIVASINQFDNVTKRGWPALFFDHYIVWNKYNKAELERINPLLAEKEKVSIAGAPQFDFHYKHGYCWDKKTWLNNLGLPHNKKIILYAGGSENLFPDEPQYLKHLVDALESGVISDDAVILLRCHPLDKVARWKSAIGPSGFVYYDSRYPVNRKMDYDNVTDNDIIKLVSTLKHTDVHVNVCSTMTVDGSVFNKPIIGPYYDELQRNNEKVFRAFYKQEHYMPILHTNVVQLTSSKKELGKVVNDALKDPSSFVKNSKACVEEIITYTDGQSAHRVADILKSFFEA